MKPAPFRHHAPKTIEEAVQTLAEVAGEDGRVLAGGQSLVPIMAFRLARPAHLVDINGVAELQRLAVDGDRLVIGACVRHAAFHRPVVAGPLGLLLSRVVRHIAHYPIRTRGTFCGSLAHADRLTNNNSAERIFPSDKLYSTGTWFALARICRPGRLRFVNVEVRN